ncbi:hypothetical protein AALO_G00296720 [Alosa alosa]|uniref:Uncharacterized protein n=1 Tax=Alosa alosa TaxID=278164 RepID=A0AAV6FE75_9TELE|nr:hypothetical protein AALO_G00296720 [Alosa alosa]
MASLLQSLSNCSATRRGDGGRGNGGGGRDDCSDGGRGDGRHGRLGTTSFLSWGNCCRGGGRADCSRDGDSGDGEQSLLWGFIQKALLLFPLQSHLD